MSSSISNLISLAKELADRFNTSLVNPSEVARRESGGTLFVDLCMDLHFFNTSLWKEEDLARRTKVTDSEIAGNKRAIDRFNQSRNDLIEKIDDLLLGLFEGSLKTGPMVIRSSETAGSMIDRISILSLKIHHMSLHARRSNIDDDHRQTVQSRLEKLFEQRRDLVESLTELLEGMLAGNRYYKIYRQFKMYNDPNLNPSLIAERNEQTE